MEPLDFPDLHFLNAARGWLDLNQSAEAWKELGQVEAARANHPDILEVRWLILAHEKRWETALETACQLMQIAPDRPAGWIDQSYALHELQRTEAALRALLPAVERFPQISTIPYNLACYHCRLGNLDEARRWLRRAIAVGDKVEIRTMGLRDADLRELWEEIRGF